MLCIRRFPNTDLLSVLACLSMSTFESNPSHRETMYPVGLCVIGGQGAKEKPNFIWDVRPCSLLFPLAMDPCLQSLYLCAGIGEVETCIENKVIRFPFTRFFSGLGGYPGTAAAIAWAARCMEHWETSKPMVASANGRLAMGQAQTQNREDDKRKNFRLL